MNFKINFFQSVIITRNLTNVVAYGVENDIRLLSAVNKHKNLLVSQFRRKLLYSTVTALILTLTLTGICYCAHFFVSEVHI